MEIEICKVIELLEKRKFKPLPCGKNRVHYQPPLTNGENTLNISITMIFLWRYLGLRIIATFGNRVASPLLLVIKKLQSLNKKGQPLLLVNLNQGK